MTKRGRWLVRAALGLVALTVGASGALAQGAGVSLDLGAGESGYVRLVLLFASASLAPALLAVVTAFARIMVVLLLLRAGLGAQEIPPTQILVGLAILLTVVTMLPTLGPIYDHAVGPLLADEIDLAQAGREVTGPLRGFMAGQVRPRDLELMASLAQLGAPPEPADAPLSVLASAFALSELRAAFIIGFVIYLPFVIIDLVVASTLASAGLLALPSAVLALPFKLLLFVMVDGWSLLTEALLSSFR